MIVEPSGVTLPLQKISKALVSWLKVRKLAIAPGGSELMLGYSTRTGGLKVAPPGWKVQAKGAATPSGIGMGTSS